MPYTSYCKLHLVAKSYNRKKISYDANHLKSKVIMNHLMAKYYKFCKYTHLNFI